MSLVPETDRQAAHRRLTNKWAEFTTDEDRATYFFMVLSILGNSAPEVLGFTLDRTDAALEAMGLDR